MSLLQVSERIRFGVNYRPPLEQAWRTGKLTGLIMNIEQLNNDYGIRDHIKFIEGTGGFPYIRVDNAKPSAIIYIYAAKVLSFQPDNQPHNLMFPSQRA